MPDNGSGSHTPPSSSFPFIIDTLADATKVNAVVTDLSTAMSNRICKDGQTTLTNNIPFNGFKATGMGAGSARTDSATIANMQDFTGIHVIPSGVTGTADAIALLPNPAIAAYAVGQTFRFIVASTNTSNVTVAVSGLTAKQLFKNGNEDLAVGDLAAGAVAEITYDGTRFLLVTIADTTVTSLENAITNIAALATNHISKLTIDAKGDLITGIAADTIDRLAIGTNEQFIVADSTTAAGMKWTNTLASPTITTPTISAPVLSGTVTGTYTLGGTPTVSGTLTAGSAATQNPFAVNTVTTQAHGLGAVPVIMMVYAENISAEFGYNVGDKIFTGCDNSGGFGYLAYADATNVYIVSNATGLSIINKTTPAGQIGATSAKWKIVAVPYKVT